MKVKSRELCVLVILLFISLFISFTSAICTVTFDKETYVAGETVTAQMICSENTEKNDGYQLNWTFENGTQVELDIGTTPSIVLENFYQTYNLPSTWPNGILINATLTGTDNSDLEGSDFANITATGGGGANTLEIINTTFGGGYLGLVSSVKAKITDENGKKISGGRCEITALSNDETKVLLDVITTPINGMIEVSDILPPTRFEEGTDYSYEIHCYCGSSGGSTECIDEDGANVNNSIGSTKNFFTTKRWLMVNTVTDTSLYNLKDDIFVCANITNVDYSLRIPLHIYYQVRCSKGDDFNSDTDRIVIDHNEEVSPDARGISANSTQMQCMKFEIPEEYYLMGSNSECYGSTNVWVLDNSHNEILGYATTSPIFNISSNEINIEADWSWTSDTSLNSIVNLSNFNDVSGTGTGNIDVRLFVGSGVNLENIFDIANLISNITVKDTTTTLTEHTDYELEFLEDGYVELEIRNTSLSTNWFNITIDFYDNELRQTEALEGIENKTGTFHLDVNCPSSAALGSDMNCSITAYVEDSQTVEKEVDFTCFISDGTNNFSSLNFNQMINRTSLTMYKTFAIPSNFTSGSSYVLQCYADYYNLGSRRDSFYDTFYAGTIPSGSSSHEGTSTLLAGAVIGSGTNKTAQEILESFNPLSPERNWFFMALELIVLAGIAYSLVLLSKKKTKITSKNENSWDVIKKILAIIIAIGIVILLVVGIKYGIGLINNPSQTTITGTEETSQILLQGNLPNSIFLIFIAVLVTSIVLILFTTILLIIISKLLNVKGEISFGDDYQTRRFKEQKRTERLQRRLDRKSMKDRFKRKEIKEDYKVRTMTQKEFLDYMKKKNAKD